MKKRFSPFIKYQSIYDKLPVSNSLILKVNIRKYYLFFDGINVKNLLYVMLFVAAILADAASDFSSNIFMEPKLFGI